VGLFEDNGGRMDRSILKDERSMESWISNGRLGGETHFSERMPPSTVAKKDYYGMRNAIFKSGPDGPHGGKQNVALIKPYIVSRYRDPNDQSRVQHFPMDKCRIFGKAISNANPFEMVDVMLSRQAI
jgi:hypothetical protein